MFVYAERGVCLQVIRAERQLEKQENMTDAQRAREEKRARRCLLASQKARVHLWASYLARRTKWVVFGPLNPGDMRAAGTRLGNGSARSKQTLWRRGSNQRASTWQRGGQSTSRRTRGLGGVLDRFKYKSDA